MSETAWKRLEIGVTAAALAALALVCARLLGVIGDEYRDVIANVFAVLVVALLLMRYRRYRSER